MQVKFKGYATPEWNSEGDMMACDEAIAEYFATAVSLVTGTAKRRATICTARVAAIITARRFPPDDQQFYLVRKSVNRRLFFFFGFNCGEPPQ